MKRPGATMDFAGTILRIFADSGARRYDGEGVTQLEHALQTARAAEREAAANELVVAALLHDIGHLVHGAGEDVALRGIDTRHEAIGARWLSRAMDEKVTEPIRLHVAAKRFLCARDAAYERRLSDASRLSLELQGGPMSRLEAGRFERDRYSLEAVRLRRWDDVAKEPGLTLPAVESFRARIEAAITRDRAMRQTATMPST